MMEEARSRSSRMLCPKTTHKRYSSNYFASANGKFRMSLQEDIQGTTNI